MSVLDSANRTLLRTQPSPLTPRTIAGLRGAHPAGTPPHPPSATTAISVERIVSSSGGIMISHQRVQVGRSHARKLVTATLDDTTIRIYDGPTLLATVGRTTTQEISHHGAHRH